MPDLPQGLCSHIPALAYSFDKWLQQQGLLWTAHVLCFRQGAQHFAGYPTKPAGTLACMLSSFSRV